MKTDEISCFQTYHETLQFAISAHGDQKYGSNPYVAHLVAASMVLTRFNFSVVDPVSGLILHQAALLHDCIEDAKIEYKQLASRFGERVADIVYCVTDELGRSRDERHEKTYPKIRSNPDAIIVKLADRIANAEFSTVSRSSQMDKYRREFPGFKQALFNGNNLEMWNHLESVLSV
jgi:(p)ppGpp synthase/HD superfamily hydrolase